MQCRTKRYLYLSAASFANLQKNDNFIGRSVSRIFKITIYVDLYHNQAFIVDADKCNDFAFLTKLTNFIQQIKVPKTKRKGRNKKKKQNRRIN